jgi:dTDP-glucose 4,6-dehydratase/UDP-glucose 4-epimerase
MVILVIGSKGFIGKVLYDFLSDKGYLVLGCDIFKKNICETNYFEINSNYPDYNFIFNKYSISYCINCSGSANVQFSMKEPYSDFLLNTLNVFNILDTIRKKSPLTKFINFSSAAVYGNPINLPIEEDSILSPVSPYGIHKMQSEQICKQFYDFYDIKVCSLRIFSVYGVGLKKQLFWDLFKKLEYNEPIVLFGTGFETRDFIYIDDIVNAINIIIEKGSYDAEVYNVGSGCCISIKDVTRLFYSQFDENITFEFKGEPKVGDPIYWQADIKKITDLGFKQSISIDLGLEKYSKWLKELN